MVLLSPQVAGKEAKKVHPGEEEERKNEVMRFLFTGTGGL